jgi:hypothetical protein
MERGIFVPMMIPAFPDNPCSGGGTGTVTSVGITTPAIFAVSNSPITTSGDIAITLVNQSPNLVFASPTTAPAAPPTFRTLVAPDLGTGTANVNTVLRGDMTWGDATAIVGWTPSLNTSAPNNTVNASRLLVNSTSANGDAVIQPKGTGALLGDLPDGTSAGGNKRGIYAVDLQLERTNANQVALGNYSALIAGSQNRAEGIYSAVLGGVSNFVSGTSSIILGGSSNTVSANIGAILSGSSHSITAEFATIVGGGGGVANAYNQKVYSAAAGQASGTRQQEEYIVTRGTTSGIDGNALVELTCNGFAPLFASTPNQISVSNNAVYAFRGIVAAFGADTNAGTRYTYCAEFKGVVRRLNAATITLVGCPTVTVLADDSSSKLVFDIQVDTVNNALRLLGQNNVGINAYGVWNAHVQLTKIGF